MNFDQQQETTNISLDSISRILGHHNDSTIQRYRNTQKKFDIPDDELDIGGGSEIDINSPCYGNLEENQRIVAEIAQIEMVNKINQQWLQDVEKLEQQLEARDEESQKKDLSTFVGFLILTALFFGFYIYSQIDNEKMIYFVQQDLYKAQKELKIAKNKIIELEGDKAQEVLNKTTDEKIHRILNPLPILNGDEKDIK